MIVRYDRRFRTNEDWYPAYPGGYVKGHVSHVQYSKYDYVVIAFWGADDFGLEMQFEGDAKKPELAIAKYSEWVNLMAHMDEFVTQSQLRSMGFQHA